MIISKIIDKLSPYLEPDKIITYLSGKRFLSRTIDHYLEFGDTRSEFEVIQVFARYMDSLWENDTEKFVEYGVRQFDDVELVNGQIYIDVDGFDELSPLFDSDSESFVEQLLNGEGHELFYYNDYLPDSWSVDYTLSKLSDETKNELKKQIAVMMENVIGETIVIDDDELFSHNEEIKFSTDHIKQIMNQDLSYIIDLSFKVDDFEDIKDFLQRLYNNAQRCGMEDMYHNRVMDEIHTIFGVKKEWVKKQGREYLRLTLNVDVFIDALKDRLEYAIASERDFIFDYNNFIDELREYMYEQGSLLSINLDSDYADDEYILRCIEENAMIYDL